MLIFNYMLTMCILPRMHDVVMTGSVQLEMPLVGGQPAGTDMVCT